MAHSTWLLSSVLLLLLLLATQEVQGRRCCRGRNRHSYFRRGSSTGDHVVHRLPVPRGPPPAYSPRKHFGGVNSHEAPPASHLESTNTRPEAGSDSSGFSSVFSYSLSNDYWPHASGTSGGNGGGDFHSHDLPSRFPSSIHDYRSNSSLLHYLKVDMPYSSRHNHQPLPVTTEAPRRAPSSFAPFHGRTASPASGPDATGDSQLAPLSGVGAPPTTTSTTPPPSSIIRSQVRDPKDPTSSVKVDAYPPPSEGTPAVVGTIQQLTVE